MIFWIVAGLLTLASIGITILPVLGNKQAVGSPLEYDKEIYKARLLEIEEELAQGAINKKEYDYALAEEGRRFLALASNTNSSDKLQPPGSKNLAMIGAVVAAILIPLIALTGYSEWGAFDVPDQPLQARLEADPRGLKVEVLLQRAENQLLKNPDDGRGWMIIAPVYMRVGRMRDAALAYRNAIRTNEPTAELLTSLGEVLTVIAEGVVTQEAVELFQKAKDADPTYAKPGFFLAFALNQSGEYEKAIVAWNKLISTAPSNAPWLELARQQLQLAQSNTGVQNPGNPTATDIEEAGKLSSDERQEFINSMVERLAEELQENPQNKAGWKRIIRSYAVLGRKSDALAAITTAQSVFKDDDEFIRELERNKATISK